MHRNLTRNCKSCRLRSFVYTYIKEKKIKAEWNIRNDLVVWGRRKRNRYPGIKKLGLKSFDASKNRWYSLIIFFTLVPAKNSISLFVCIYTRDLHALNNCRKNNRKLYLVNRGIRRKYDGQLVYLFTKKRRKICRENIRIHRVEFLTIELAYDTVDHHSNCMYKKDRDTRILILSG